MAWLPRTSSTEDLQPAAHEPIISVFWSLWHLPLHLNGTYSSGWLGLAQVVARIIMGTPFTVLMTWLYNRTERSLPLLMLLHASNNTAPQFLNAGFLEQFPTLVLAIVVLVRDKMWKMPDTAPRTEGATTEA